jgi:hypothetical protein
MRPPHTQVLLILKGGDGGGEAGSGAGSPEPGRMAAQDLGGGADLPAAHVTMATMTRFRDEGFT